MYKSYSAFGFSLYDQNTTVLCVDIIMIICFPDLTFRCQCSHQRSGVLCETASMIITPFSHFYPQSATTAWTQHKMSTE